MATSSLMPVFLIKSTVTLKSHHDEISLLIHVTTDHSFPRPSLNLKSKIWRKIKQSYLLKDNLC